MAVMYATGIIHNQTDSIPTGFYRRIQRPPRKGELVIVTTPRNEFTDTHPIHEGLIKNLVAVEGDRVTIDGQGIRVNGVLLEKSRPVDFLAPANVDKTLEPGEIIVASAYNRLSYDSRYFGIIGADTVQCVVVPLLTWGIPNETIEALVDNRITDGRLKQIQKTKALESFDSRVSKQTRRMEPERETPKRSQGMSL